MGDTSAPLIAALVRSACYRVVAEIECKRHETMSKIVADVVRRVSNGGPSDVPPEEALIVELYRKDELDRMRKIIELCEAVSDVPEIRIDVSLDDFQVIKREYATQLRLSRL